jgi:hypothetical protein
MQPFNIPVYIALKNADLHALSAFEAFTQVMGVSRLVRLNRYRVVTLSFLAPSFAEAQHMAEHFVRRTFSVFNTHKEVFHIGEFSRKSVENRHRFWIEVAWKTPADPSVSAQRLAPDLALVGMTQTWVWEIEVQDSRPKEEVWKSVMEDVVMTQDRLHGLLANPVYETVNRLELSS